MAAVAGIQLQDGCRASSRIPVWGQTGNISNLIELRLFKQTRPPLTHRSDPAGASADICAWLKKCARGAITGSVGEVPLITLLALHQGAL